MFVLPLPVVNKKNCLKLKESASENNSDDSFNEPSQSSDSDSD